MVKRLVEDWRALRGPIGVDEDGEGRWSEEYNSDACETRWQEDNVSARKVK